ncbi:MAG: Na+/H+ antiporter NhaA [Rhodoglobus sp.]
MGVLRSERFAALLLVVAAVLGLLFANSAAAPLANAVVNLRLGWGLLDLSVAHWIKDGLLAVFFFIAAIELRHELKHGELDTARKALVPTIAAIGGVVVPALIYLVLAPGAELSRGWPIPTATDIAFALGVLAIVGRGLPANFRALLLALAVIDDLIAIIIIAAFFTTDLSPAPLLLAVPVIGLFGWLSYRVVRSRWVVVALVLLGITAWVLVYLAGIHPTIAGVALGLVMADGAAAKTRRAIEPWSNAAILPLFAFVAALVPIPAASIGELSPAFWAVIVALPLGKIAGITAGALIAAQFAQHPATQRMPASDIVAIAALGGIGFTVSLLMNELAFESQPDLVNQVTLAVLVASGIAAIIGGSLTALRSRSYRRG